jgi:hypothetical protein
MKLCGIELYREVDCYFKLKDPQSILRQAQHDEDDVAVYDFYM